MYSKEIEHSTLSSIMVLRITGGSLRGRYIKAPKESSTRPTQEVVRKAVFDILQDRIEDAFVLDLFAGSGAVGIEAISRGAKRAVLLEKSKKTTTLIYENCNLLQISDQIDIRTCDVLKEIEKKALQSISFSLIYIDPPYGESREKGFHTDAAILKILHVIDKDFTFDTSCYIFIENDAAAPLDLSKETFSRLIFRKKRTFGGAALHELLYQKE